MTCVGVQQSTMGPATKSNVEIEAGDVAKAITTVGTIGRRGRDRKRKQRESVEVKEQVEHDAEVNLKNDDDGVAAATTAVDEKQVEELPASLSSSSYSWLSKEQLEKVRIRGAHWHSLSFLPYCDPLPTKSSNSHSSKATHGTKRQTSKRPGFSQKRKTGPTIPIIRSSLEEPLVELYGKQIPICTEGICCQCQEPSKDTTSVDLNEEEYGGDTGKKKEESKGKDPHYSDMFQCSTCLRYFHFHCNHSLELKDDTHLSTANASQTCTFCDPLDASIYLLQYFERCNEERVKYDSSYEYVLHSLKADIELQLKLLNERRPDEEEPLGDDESPSGHLARFNFVSAVPDEPLTVVFEEYTGDRIEDASKTNRSTDNTFKIKRPETELDYIHELSPSLNSKRRNNTLSNIAFSPESLVGKCVHLYSPMDNAYHVGRIIEWRNARPFMKLHSAASITSAATNTNSTTTTTTCTTTARCSEFYGKEEIHKCEFLVRFLPGVNGRKRMVQEWIILEEHSLALGIDLIWANSTPAISYSGDKRNAATTTSTATRTTKKRWMPAILFLRTSREIVTDIENLTQVNEETTLVMPQDVLPEDYTVACLFFLEGTWAFPRVHDEVIDFFSPQYTSHRNQPANRAIQLAVTLAYVEAMEQIEVRKWYQMVSATSNNPFHVSILDYNSLPPLLLDVDDNCEDKRRKIRSLLKSSYQQQFPRLCHQIRLGMDHLWISHLASGRKKMKDHGINAVDSLRRMNLQLMPSSLIPRMMKEIKNLQKQSIGES
jgi:hypothetical protein